MFARRLGLIDHDISAGLMACRDKTFQPARREGVIGVQNSNPFPLGRRKPNIPCTRWAGVRCKPNDIDTAVLLRKVLDHTIGVVAGRIIHNE